MRTLLRGGHAPNRLSRWLCRAVKIQAPPFRHCKETVSMSEDVKAKSVPVEYEIAHIWQRGSLTSGRGGKPLGVGLELRVAAPRSLRHFFAFSRASIRRLIANRNLVQSRCCNRRDLVLHFDITQIDQCLQIIRGDRAELQALPYNVPQDPA
jgi:hypothetical protein